MKKRKKDTTKEQKTDTITPLEEKPFTSSKAYLIISIFAVTLYLNTIPNKYALDDGLVITQNKFTTRGIGAVWDILTHDTFTGYYGKQINEVAGGRYRPLSLITFAVEYQFFGQNPHISHAINVLLYMLTCIVLFQLLLKLQKGPYSDNIYFSAPFLAVLLFTAHPVHTEAITNIKGRDEILCLLFLLLALIFMVKYYDTKNSRHNIEAILCFFLALLSKENAITFIAIAPLTLYFMRHEAFIPKLRLLISLSIPPIVFLCIRQAVLGNLFSPASSELLNNPFLNAETSQKSATICLTLWRYLKLLFFPHPLTFDYYPYHIPIIDWADVRAVLSLTLYVSLAVYSAASLKKRFNHSFGILWYLITLSIASNIFFPIGTFMNERFLYIPSVGFCIFAASFFSSILQRLKAKHLYAVVPMVFILTLFSLKTITRNLAWHDNYTLFTTDVKTSSNSALSNTLAAGEYMKEAQKEKSPSTRTEKYKEAKRLLERAVKIHPAYLGALQNLGYIHFILNNDIDSAMYYYKKALTINPDFSDIYKNIEASLAHLNDTGYKLKVYRELYRLNPNRYEINFHLGTLFLLGNILDSAVIFLEKAVNIKPSAAEAAQNLGAAYGMTGQFQKSALFLEKALNLSPGDEELCKNLGHTYEMLGDEKMSRYYYNKAELKETEQ